MPRSSSDGRPGRRTAHCHVAQHARLPLKPLPRGSCRAHRHASVKLWPCQSGWTPAGSLPAAAVPPCRHRPCFLNLALWEAWHDGALQAELHGVESFPLWSDCYAAPAQASALGRPAPCQDRGRAVAWYRNERRSRGRRQPLVCALKPPPAAGRRRSGAAAARRRPALRITCSIACTHHHLQGLPHRGG